MSPYTTQTSLYSLIPESTVPQRRAFSELERALKYYRFARNENKIQELSKYIRDHKDFHIYVPEYLQNQVLHKNKY
jgi:hypothetical protein